MLRSKLLNESLAGNWPHSSLSVLISRHHANFPSCGIWQEFSPEKNVLGGEILTQCAEGVCWSCQGVDHRKLCLSYSLWLPPYLLADFRAQCCSECKSLLWTNKILIQYHFASGIMFSYLQLHCFSLKLSSSSLVSTALH